MARTFSDGTEGQPGAAPESTLASGISIGATSSTVAAGHGARFPASGTFSIRFEDATDPTHFEIVDCSSRSTDTLTHGATTYAWDPGDKVIHVISKTDLEGFVQDTGDETIAGVKTFSSIPVGPASDPTTDNQLSRKKYVDDGLALKQALSAKGQNDGYASLDSGGDVPLSQLGNVPAATAYSLLTGFVLENLPASASASKLRRAIGVNTTANFTTLSIVMLRGGSITGLAVSGNAARTAGTATYEVYVNGAAIGLTVVIDGTHTQYWYSTQAAGTDTFAAGDLLDVRVTTDGSWAPITSDWEAAIEVIFV